MSSGTAFIYWAVSEILEAQLPSAAAPCLPAPSLVNSFEAATLFRVAVLCFAVGLALSTLAGWCVRSGPPCFQSLDTTLSTQSGTLELLFFSFILYFVSLDGLEVYAACGSICCPALLRFVVGLTFSQPSVGRVCGQALRVFSSGLAFSTWLLCLGTCLPRLGCCSTSSVDGMGYCT